MDELLRFITMLIPVYFSNIRSIFHFIYCDWNLPYSKETDNLETMAVDVTCSCLQSGCCVGFCVYFNLWVELSPDAIFQAGTASDGRIQCRGARGVMSVADRRD